MKPGIKIRDAQAPEQSVIPCQASVFFSRRPAITAHQTVHKIPMVIEIPSKDGESTFASVNPSMPAPASCLPNPPPHMCLSPCALQGLLMPEATIR